MFGKESIGGCPTCGEEMGMHAAGCPVEAREERKREEQAAKKKKKKSKS